MKLKVLTLSSLLVLCVSCYSPGSQVAGTMIGAEVGGHIGSMIGGRHGGFMGDVFGTILGTVAGAAVGHAVTTPPEDRVVVVKERDEDYSRDRDYRDYRGYDATTRQGRPTYENDHASEIRKGSEILNNLAVHNLRFVDSGKNRVINSDETCQLLFEVHNEGNQVARNITPLVYEVNKMRHIYISSPAVIAQLRPGEFVTYTITIRSDRKLSRGTATFSIELSDDNGTCVPCREFDIPTER